MTVTCGLCGCRQSCESSLLSHKRAAHVKGGLKCLKCPCTFKSARSRLRHIVIAHRERYKVRKRGIRALRPRRARWSAPPIVITSSSSESDDDSDSDYDGKSTTTTSSRTLTTTRTKYKKKTKSKNLTDDDGNDHSDPAAVWTPQFHQIIVDDDDDDGYFESLPPPNNEAGIEKVVTTTTTSNFSDINFNPSLTKEDEPNSSKDNDLIFTESAAKKPKMKSTTMWLKCKYCGYRSLEKLPLAMHILGKHNFDKLQCNLCFLQFPSTNHLEIHYQESHRKPTTIKGMDEMLNFESTIEMNLDDLYQAGVRVKLSVATKLMKYLNSNNNNDEESCDDGVDFVRMRQLTKECSQEKLRWKRDVMIWKQSKWPKVSSIDNSDGDSFRCEICGFAFNSQKNRRRHFKRSHVPGGAFKCKLCPCAFAIYNGWRGHMIAYHRLAYNNKNKSLEKTIPPPPPSSLSSDPPPPIPLLFDAAAIVSTEVEVMTTENSEQNIDQLNLTNGEEKSDDTTSTLFDSDQGQVECEVNGEEGDDEDDAALKSSNNFTLENPEQISNSPS